jgi:hypothetical protein
MTEYSDDFKAQYPKDYGPSFRCRKPDYARCAASVADGGRMVTSSQCRRKNGHGPEGAWCKQHDPQASAAKKQASAAKKAARHAAWKRELDQKARDVEFASESKNAIRAIAEGHNDPMTLAREILARYEGKA